MDPSSRHYGTLIWGAFENMDCSFSLLWVEFSFKPRSESTNWARNLSQKVSQRLHNNRKTNNSWSGHRHKFNAKVPHLEPRLRDGSFLSRPERTSSSLWPSHYQQDTEELCLTHTTTALNLGVSGGTPGRHATRKNRKQRFQKLVKSKFHNVSKMLDICRFYCDVRWIGT